MNKQSHRMPEKGRTHSNGLYGHALPENDFATNFCPIAMRFRLLACNEEAPEHAHPENTALIVPETVADPESLIVAANESGEQLLVPFVERSVNAMKPDGTQVKSLQVFDAVAANEIVDKYNSTLAKLKRTITGLLGMGTSGIPVYYRHPDGNPDHVDRREYGLAENLRVGADGLYGRIAYNEFGERLLKEVKGLRISPVWYLRPLPGSKDLSKTRPHQLLSLGLTQFPNIRNAVAVNEDPNSTKNKKTMHPELLKALLKLLAFNEARIEATINGGSDAISITEAQNAFAPFATAANEAPKIPDLEKQVSDLTASNEAAETKATEIEAQLTEYKGLLAANEVESAISAGKIKPAEKDARIKALVEAEDFTVACNELDALEDGKAVKTTSVTQDLAHQQSKGLMAANEASEQFQKLVAANEAEGMSYDAAWAAAERSTEGQKLVAVIHKDRSAE
jgi:hypothetical protein